MLQFYLSLVITDEEKTKLELIYHEYRSAMKHTALGILKDEFLAEDAVHEAFIKLTRHLDGVEEIYSHRTLGFVVRIAKTISLDMLKMSGRRPSVSLDEDYFHDIIPDKRGEIDLADVEFSCVVEKVKMLPKIYQDVIFLKFKYDYTDKKIADILGISYATVRKRLERARELMDYYLKDWRE